MFNKLLHRDRKAKQKNEERERACMVEIGEVLQRHNCMLEPVLKGDSRSIYADLQITALPNDVRPSATLAPEASIASQDKAEEQAARVGEPIDSSKLSEKGTN